MVGTPRKEESHYNIILGKRLLFELNFKTNDPTVTCYKYKSVTRGKVRSSNVTFPSLSCAATFFVCRRSFPLVTIANKPYLFSVFRVVLSRKLKLNMLTEAIAQPFAHSFSELWQLTFIHFLLLNKFRFGVEFKFVSAVSVLGEYRSPENYSCWHSHLWALPVNLTDLQGTGRTCRLHTKPRPYWCEATMLTSSMAPLCCTL